MIMMLSMFAVIGGLYLLTLGANWLVDGGSSIAAKFKVPSIVIGLTIVAFGTSTPELVVSISSALSGTSDIALGNVVGSNIFNILGILGITALIAPITVNRATFWKEIPLSLIAALFVLMLATGQYIDNGIFAQVLTHPDSVSTLSVTAGVILVIMFGIFLAYTFSLAKKGAHDNHAITQFPTQTSLLYIAGGIAALVVGGRIVVWGAVEIAQAIGITERVIGLTVVAIGTSLPELVTSIQAVKKKQDDIAVGNIIGSSLFNIFGILGITLLVNPIVVTSGNIQDILVLIATTILLMIALYTGKKYILHTTEGVLMVGVYAIYVTTLIV
jgi:cation:H+ antiporter